MNSFGVSLRVLAELEHYTNLKEVHLWWSVDTSVKEALSMLKRCTNLRRLTLKKTRRLSTSSEELCDFIMELKQLTFLHIIYDHRYDCYLVKSVVDRVEAFVLLRRPNFEFYLSCCSKCESRVPREDASWEVWSVHQKVFADVQSCLERNFRNFNK